MINRVENRVELNSKFSIELSPIGISIRLNSIIGIPMNSIQFEIWKGLSNRTNSCKKLKPRLDNLEKNFLFWPLIDTQLLKTSLTSYWLIQTQQPIHVFGVEFRADYNTGMKRGSSCTVFWVKFRKNPINWIYVENMVNNIKIMIVKSESAQNSTPKTGIGSSFSFFSTYFRPIFWISGHQGRF